MKHIFWIACIIVPARVFSQNYADVQRFSTRLNTGDARYSAMGGAFSSLGGNVASIADNPAAVAVFNKGTISMTVNNRFSDTKSSYFNYTQRSKKANLCISNLGLVLNFPLSDNELHTKSLNISYTFNRVNDFYNKTTVDAHETNSSMTDEFLRDIEQNGVDKARAESHDAWQTYVVDFDSVSRSFYTPFVYGSSNNRILENGVRQRILVNSSGRTNDNTFAIGLDVNNMVYVGGSINITSLVFNERFEYSETDDMNRVPSFDRYALSRDLRQTGRGVNLRTGIIVTPNKKIRLGVSYHFPTSWTVNELYSSYTNSHFSTSAGNKSYTSPSSGNGDYSNSYSIITPGRAIVGASVVLFKSLIVATDYEYCRFNRASFTSSDDWVSVENTIIGQELRAAGALKCGAELRVGPLRLRGGSAFYQNPYTRYDNTLKNCQSIYSGGVGIKSKSTTFDVSMSRSFSKNYKYIYTDYDGYERVVGSGISEVHLLMSFGLLL